MEKSLGVTLVLVVPHGLYLSVMHAIKKQSTRLRSLLGGMQWPTLKKFFFVFFVLGFLPEEMETMPT